MQQISKSPEQAQASTIMVVEDEVLLRMDLGRTLRHAGHRVIECDSAAEALSLLMADTPVDLVITDLRMPGAADGRDLVQWTRRRAPEIKIMVVSAYIDAYWDIPVDAVLKKPVASERLLRYVGRLLEPSE